MIVHSFKFDDLEGDLLKIKGYFEAALDKNPKIKESPAIVNYQFDNNPASLERLVRDGKFKTGEYLVVTDDDDQLMVASGYYRHNGLVMAGVRFLMAPPNYQQKKLPLFSGLMLPAILERTPNEPHVFTFNEYNTRLMEHIFVVAKENKKKLLKHDPLFEVALNAIQPFTVSRNQYIINFAKQRFVFDMLTEERVAQIGKFEVCK